MGDHVDPYRLYLQYPSAQPEAGRMPLDSLDPYYTGAEMKEVQAELDKLFESFRTEVCFGQRHYAPSPSWRDEMTTRKGSVPMPQRFVVRVHLFEKRGRRTGAQPGRYIGFVSLRPPGSVAIVAQHGPGAEHAFRYVIDAELTTPSHMQRPRYHVLTTTASSARLGVLPFRSAVYSTPKLTESRGSTCMHLAVSQALHLMMGRFACRPISQIEFNWHLWKTSASKGESIGAMGRRGATPNEALNVVRDSCNGGGYQITVEPRNQRDGRLSPTERALAARFLTDALACGLPVIALVRTKNLLPKVVCKALEKEARHPRKRSAVEKRLNAPHAVLVLGMHLLHSEEEAQSLEEIGWQDRPDRAELPGRLVIHDTLSRGPYFECMISDFMNAAQDVFPECTGPEDAAPRGVHLLVLGPRGLKLGHHQVYMYVRNNLFLMLKSLPAAGSDATDPDLAALLAYMDATRVPADLCTRVENWMVICRFMSAQEISSRYLGHRGMAPSTDVPNDLPDTYYWALEVRHPRAKKRRTEEDVTGPSDIPPALVFIWDHSLSYDDKDYERELGPPPTVMLRHAHTPA